MQNNKTFTHKLIVQRQKIDGAKQN